MNISGKRVLPHPCIIRRVGLQWRSVQYEEVYLRAHDSVAEARASIDKYLGFYNLKRLHSSLDTRTPGLRIQVNIA